jgi:hypothetical protein
LAFLQALSTGLQLHLPNGTFTIGSAPYTTASLITLAKSLTDAITAVNVAEATAKDAVAKLNALKVSAVPVLMALRRILVAMYSGTTQTLTDFGITPPKARTPLTAEQLAAKAAKARATRAARGTASKKKKAAVKGNVTTKAVLYVSHFLGACKDEFANFARVPTLAPADTRLPLRACPRHTR